MVRRATRRSVRALVAANIAGGLVAFVFLQFLAPGSFVRGPGSSNFVVVYLVVAVGYAATAIVVSLRLLRPRVVEPPWYTEGRSPSPGERGFVLGLPRRVVVVTLTGWTGAAVVFGAINAGLGTTAVSVVRVVVGIVLAGLVTSLMSHLIAVRELRAVVAIVLAGEPEAVRQTAGIRSRLLRSWLLGSAVPLLAIALTPLARTSAQRVDLAVPVVFLAVVGIATGLLVTETTASSVSGPIESVRAVLDTVRRGDLTAEVPVADTGELGSLEAGVNQMIAGLRERQLLEDLFGRHVGVEVARAAASQTPSFTGQVQDASLLFVDVAGSSRLATTLAPKRLVALLNDLFGVIVPVVTAEGGWVNKFEGDAALCVFGVPVAEAEQAARALRAARAVEAQVACLRDRWPQLEVGNGVSSGPVVAGNVGAMERYEFTVIGQTVNEAARLADAAKERGVRVLASARSVDGAGEEAGAWQPAGSVELRGIGAVDVARPTSEADGGPPGRPDRHDTGGNRLTVDPGAPVTLDRPREGA